MTASTDEERSYSILRSLLAQDGSLAQAKGLPWITLTYAQSLDGFIGGPNGTPLTLSSPASFTFTHGLRATHDAILVGVNTVIADNPSLTTRLVSKGLNGLGAENPRPIVLDGHLRVPETAKIFSFQHRPGYGPIIITAGNPQDQEKQARLESLGATILCVPGDSSTGRINMKLALQQLFSKFRVRSVMIEGGATVIQTVLKDETLDIDLLAITIAPKFVGTGIHSTTGDMQQLQTAIKPVLSDTQYHSFGPDIILTAKVSRTINT